MSNHLARWGLAFLCSLAPMARAALSQGDIAFIGLNANTSDWIAFVALKPIAPGETIYFTDNELIAPDAATFNTGESYSKWVAPQTNLPAGTVITIDTFETAPAASLGKASVVAISGSTGRGLSVSGDSVYAYTAADDQSANVPVVHLAFFHLGATAPTATSGLAPASLPASLQVVFSDGRDGSLYTGPRNDQASFPDYLALIADPLHWSNPGNTQTPLSALSTASFTIAEPIERIHVIQGADNLSPLVNETRTVQAIVVGRFPGSGNLGGFYIQEEDADADANPATSEGLFVEDPSGLFTGSVGDKVQVTGKVGEMSPSGSAVTMLTGVTRVTNLGPAGLPGVTTIQLPFADGSSLERYEGMLVNVSAPGEPLVITDLSTLGRFGEVTLAAGGVGNQAGTDARLDIFTHFNQPSVAGYASYQAGCAQRTILLDDGRSVQNPDPITFGRGGNPLSSTNPLRCGDTISSVTGVMDQRTGKYRVQTTSPVSFAPGNPRPNSPPNVGGVARIAAFDLFNYFNDLGTGFVTVDGFTISLRGAKNPTEFVRQKNKLMAALVGSGADLFALCFLENNGHGPGSAIQDLVNGLNSVAGPGTYAFITSSNRLGLDSICVGIVYKPERFIPLGVAATMPDGYGSGAFDLSGRKPLAQTFRHSASGDEFTLAAVHFRSRGNNAGGEGDQDQADGQGFSNGTRTRQAQDLAAWLATNPTGSSDADYIIVGNLSTYRMEDPLAILANAGYGLVLPAAEYSFGLAGQFGSIYHALVSPSMDRKISGSGSWHINADEPSVIDFRTDFKSSSQLVELYSPDAFRASDNDPLIAGFNFAALPQLEISQTGGKVIVSWSGTAAGWVLQTNSTLSGGTWGDYSGSVVNNAVTNAAVSGPVYYRLKQP